ncbi:MAG: S49 family peptidase [Acetobacterales bacterium]
MHIPFLPRASRPLVTMVRLSGTIGRLGPIRNGLTLEQMAPVLERAIPRKGAVAVALVINSPGGSPVQSALIAGRVRALADERNLPVLAFVEDVAASGGYWLACAADEIHAHPSSIVGSIGVRSDGFGFVDLLKRLGVERRLHASGDRKVMLDPFLPEDPEDVARLEAIQRDVHDQFKTMVRERRGSRLKADEEVLFNGDIWTGREALTLGIVDGLGDARSVLRARYGERVRVRQVGARRSLFRQRWFRGGTADAGVADWGVRTAAALWEETLWARRGL